MTKSNLPYLEALHSLTSLAQEHMDLIDKIVKCDDYSGIPAEQWHVTLTHLKMTISLQQDTIKRMTEDTLRVNDKLEDIVKNFKEN